MFLSCCQVFLRGAEELLEFVPNRDPRRGTPYPVFSPENKFMNRMSKKGSSAHLDGQSSMLTNQWYWVDF